MNGTFWHYGRRRLNCVGAMTALRGAGVDIRDAAIIDSGYCLDRLFDTNPSDAGIIVRIQHNQGDAMKPQRRWVFSCFIDRHFCGLGVGFQGHAPSRTFPLGQTAYLSVVIGPLVMAIGQELVVPRKRRL